MKKERFNNIEDIEMKIFEEVKLEKVSIKNELSANDNRN